MERPAGNEAQLEVGPQIWREQGEGGSLEKAGPVKRQWFALGQKVGHEGPLAGLQESKDRTSKWKRFCY